MLSEIEKREILQDGLSKSRRDDFRFARKSDDSIPFDEYLDFLNSIQQIFGPPKVSRSITPTKFNKL